jgi:hypothetical protein
MSCCGEKRSKIYHDPWAYSGEESGTVDGQPIRIPNGSSFVYTGATSMTATGVITGTVYRFERTGDILEVDRRDASFMTGIPNLQRFKEKK